MNNYKISALSFSFIVICLLETNLLGTIFPFIIENTRYSFIYCLVLSFIIGLILLLLFLKVFSCLPSKNIIEKIDYVLPKFLSKPINFVITLIVFFIVIISFFRFSSFVSSEYLTNTPTFIIMILLSSPIFYAMFKDMDVAGRCATMIMITITFLFLFSRLSLFTMIDLDSLKPFFVDDKVKLIYSSTIVSVLHVSPLFLTLIIPKNNVINNKKIFRYLLFSYLFSFLIIALILITIIGVFGIDLASLYTYPSYVVLKNLNILNFIKNIENFSVLFWIMFMSFTCAFSLVYIKTSIKFNFNIKKQKTINIIMSSIFLLFMMLIYFIIPYENYLINHKDLYIYIPFGVYLSFIILSSFLFIFRKSN